MVFRSPTVRKNMIFPLRDHWNMMAQALQSFACKNTISRTDYGESFVCVVCLMVNNGED